MTDGAKKGKAPCGHEGTYVTANFITCDRRCGMSDGTPDKELDDVVTVKIVRCPVCKSEDVDPMGMTDVNGKSLWHCRPHGHVW